MNAKEIKAEIRFLNQCDTCDGDLNEIYNEIKRLETLIARPHNLKWNDNTGSVGKTSIHAWFDCESWKIAERFELTGINFSVTSCTHITHPSQLRKQIGNGSKYDCTMGFYLSFWLDDAGIAFLNHLKFDPTQAKWWSQRETWKQYSPLRELLTLD